MRAAGFTIVKQLTGLVGLVGIGFKPEQWRTHVRILGSGGRTNNEVRAGQRDPGSAVGTIGPLVLLDSMV